MFLTIWQISYTDRHVPFLSIRASYFCDLWHSSHRGQCDFLWLSESSAVIVNVWGPPGQACQSCAYWRPDFSKHQPHIRSRTITLVKVLCELFLWLMLILVFVFFLFYYDIVTELAVCRKYRLICSLVQSTKMMILTKN